MKIKYVIYIDSNQIHEQTDEIAKPVTIEAVGHLVDETDDYITLALEKIGDEYRSQVAIPKNAITKEDEHTNR